MSTRVSMPARIMQVLHACGRKLRGVMEMEVHFTCMYASVTCWSKAAMLQSAAAPRAIISVAVAIRAQRYAKAFRKWK